MRAMIEVLQQQLRTALETASIRANESGEVKQEQVRVQREHQGEIYKLQRQIEDYQKEATRSGQLLSQIREESNRKEQVAKEQIDRFLEENPDLKESLKAVEAKVRLVTELVKAGQKEGLPGFGKKEEIARRKKILDALEK